MVPTVRFNAVPACLLFVCFLPFDLSDIKRTTFTFRNTDIEYIKYKILFYYNINKGRINILQNTIPPFCIKNNELDVYAYDTD